MSPRTASRIGWGAFAVAALAASVAPFAWQLGFAAGAILLVGLLHGVSDLAVAPRGSWPALLAVYLAGVTITLLWWRVAPVGALAAFLVLSALHFAQDDAPPERPAERWCRGVLMIAGPALLHRGDLAQLFGALTGAPGTAALLADTLALAAVPALLALPFAAARSARLAVGVAALVVLPPLVGFAVAFTLLHAVPQLGERMAALGTPTFAAYLRRTAPVLAGTGAIAFVTALLFVNAPAPALSTLFAGLAALATPHMLGPAAWRGTASVENGVALSR